MNKLTDIEALLLQEWLTVAEDVNQLLPRADSPEERDELIFVRQRALDRATTLVARRVKQAVT